MHYRNASVAALALILSACSTPQHTNLLIFGTNTVVGLKVGADATQTPAIQLAYSRQELVLMPLLANTGGSGDNLAPCPNTTTPPPEVPVNCKFVGKQGDANLDSYSVLASFGARFDASKQDGQAKAGGAIAQYFATGLAARELATHGSSLVAATDSATAEASSKSGEAWIVMRKSKFEETADHLALSAVTDATLMTSLKALDGAAGSGTVFQSACDGKSKLECVTIIRNKGTLRLATMNDAKLDKAAAFIF